MFGIFGFLGVILIIVLFIILFVIALLGNFIRSIFGFGRRAPKHYYGEKNTSSTNNNESYTSTQSTTTSSTNGKKKIFADDEGEYVEFEGNEAFEAADGMEAVRCCRENDYDLISQDDELIIKNVFEGLKTGKLVLETVEVLL